MVVSARIDHRHARIDHKYLAGLRRPGGLFVAAHSNWYKKVWPRDAIYAAMGMEAEGDGSHLLTYHALFDLFKDDKRSVDAANGNGVPFKATYRPDTLKPADEPWGDKQNDAVGLFLFRVGRLHRRGMPVIRGEEDLKILENMVSYLEKDRYYQTPDHGMWEWEYEVHASSIGSCVAGLESVSQAVDVKPGLIADGRNALDALLPRESDSRGVDLAQLSLVWPFGVAGKYTNQIIENVERELLGTHGVKRHHGDHY